MTAGKENNDGKSLRVLFVEDSKIDADYLAFLLKNEGFTLTRERVDTAEAMEQALKNATWDVVISDYKMPDFSGPKALELVRKMNPDLPFVVVSGAVGEEMAIELMKAGANDFISKTNLSRLVPAIERELREVRDRQARKRAEEKLGESEEWFRAIFDNVTDGILVVDIASKKFVMANAGMCKMLGYSMEEVRELGVEHIHPPDRLKEVISIFERQARHEILVAEDIPVMRKDGSVFHADISSSPVAMGKQSYLAGVFRDITERKRVEERIRLSSHELIAAREEEKKRIASALHHDVGSLAVGLSAHFDAIEDDIRCEKTRDALKWMKQTRKLFAQSVVRLKQVAIELRPPELDLLGLSATLRHHFSQVTGRGNVRIHFTETLGKRRVPADVATVVFRIVQEALTNAIKHGHAKKVDIRLSASKRELSLTVRNNGNAFHLAPGGGQRSPHLGLHIMEEMASAVGGVLTVDSSPRKGTTVSAVLPLEEARFRGGVGVGGGGSEKESEQ